VSVKFCFHTREALFVESRFEEADELGKYESEESKFKMTMKWYIEHQLSEFDHSDLFACSMRKRGLV
jgi:hypothetical protein